MVKREKLKEPYETASVEIILFEFSDIVTASGGVEWYPSTGDVVGDGGWLDGI